MSKKFKPNYVADVQGDEPFVDPKDIDRVINFHKKIEICYCCPKYVG